MNSYIRHSREIADPWGHFLCLGTRAKSLHRATCFILILNQVSVLIWPDYVWLCLTSQEFLHQDIWFMRESTKPRLSRQNPHGQFLQACLQGAKLSSTHPLHPNPNKHKCPLFHMAHIPWYLQATKSLKLVNDLWGSTSTGLQGWLLKCCGDQRRNLVKRE